MKIKATPSVRVIVWLYSNWAYLIAAAIVLIIGKYAI